MVTRSKLRFAAVGLSLLALIGVLRTSFSAPHGEPAFRVTAALLTPDERKKFNLGQHWQYQQAVRCSVENRSQTKQTIETESCSWDWQWDTDSSVVHSQKTSCNGNVYVTVDLQPGERYKKVLGLFTVRGTPKQKVTFRIGFSDKQPGPANGFLPDKFWSAPLTAEFTAQ